MEEGSSLVGIPVFRIDEPMARLAAGYSRIGVAATLHSTIMPTTELIRRKAAIAGKEISIQSTVIENVGNLLAENKGDLYDEMVGEQLRLLLEEMKWWFSPRHLWQERWRDGRRKRRAAALPAR